MWTGRPPATGRSTPSRRRINEGNVITLKRLIRAIRAPPRRAPTPDAAGRIAKLTEILRNIPALQSHYRAVPLGSYIGSDSTGRSLHHYGMGLVLRETLTRQAQKAIRHTLGPTLFTLPVRMTAYLRTTYLPPADRGTQREGLRVSSLACPVSGAAGQQRRHDWEVQDDATRMETPGNVIPLGGLHEEGGNDLYLEEKHLQCGPERILEIPQQRREERPQGPDRLHPGLSDLCPDEGLVASGLWRGLHLVRHHGAPQHPPIGPRRGRHPPLPAPALERLRQLGAADRFAPLHGILGAALGLHRQDAPPRPDVRRHRGYEPADPLFRHGPGQRPLSLHPQHLPRPPEGGDLGKLLPDDPLDTAGRRLQLRHRPASSGKRAFRESAISCRSGRP